MIDRVWVLGAADPEMEHIESLLRECGERMEYATVWRDGARRRVRPEEAYAADCAIGAALCGGRERVYMVECAPAVLVGSSVDGIDWGGPMTVIDHHRPGDPGYGRPPEEFLTASSIGQTIEELARLGKLPEPQGPVLDGDVSSSIHDDGGGRGFPHPPRPWERGPLNASGPLPGVILAGHLGRWAVAIADRPRHCRAVEIPPELILAAASDHCPAAAYRGLCPGVDPDALMQWRVERRAAFQGRPAAGILADVERARSVILTAPVISLGAEPSHCGQGYCGCGPQSHGSGDPGASTAHGTGDCYCDCHDCTPCVVRDLRGVHVPEAPEASLRLGVPILTRGIPGPDGRAKVNVLGDHQGDVVRAFLGGWAACHGIADIYGDPSRGFAGGYETV